MRSTVNGHKVHLNASDLRELLGMPSKGFDVYVREDKSVLEAKWLRELTQRLSQKPNLTVPQSVGKGEMTPLHQLLFWFVIKNIVP